MGLLSLGAGVAIGYVIGTKNGKEKLDSTVESAKKTAEEKWNDPKVQELVTKASDTATKVAHDVAEGTKKAAAYASETVKQGAEKAEAAAEAAEETVSDAADAAEETVAEAAEEYTAPQTKTLPNGDVVSDPSQSTERKGTDWANEGGAKP